jgi:hypothetical protein
MARRSRHRPQKRKTSLNMINQLNQNPLNSVQLARVMAQSKIGDTFNPNSIKVFFTFRDNIYEHLKDYFYLLNDLKVEVNEELNRKYYDYCFLLTPAHKAFESYLIGFFTQLLKFKVSFKKNETVGYYLLNINDKEKAKHIESLEKKFSEYKLNFSIEKWTSAWSALGRQWQINRNPQTHPNGERMETIRKTETVADAIFREMNLSAQLFADEFYEPITNFIKKQEEEKQKLDKLKPQNENGEELGNI